MKYRVKFAQSEVLSGYCYYFWCTCGYSLNGYNPLNTLQYATKHLQLHKVGYSGEDIYRLRIMGAIP